MGEYGMFQIRSERMIYDFGTVTRITDGLTKSVTPTPIPSLPTDSAFALETNTANKFTIHFARKNPVRFNAETQDYETYEGDVDYYDLSWKWVNSLWAEAVMSLLNRWQTRTDGYKMYLNVDNVGVTTEGKYVPITDFFPTHQGINVYVEDIEIDLSAGQTEVLTGAVHVVVGGRLAEKLSVDRVNDTILVKQFNQDNMDKDYCHEVIRGRYVPLFLTAGDDGQYKQWIENEADRSDIWCYNSHNEYNDGIESAESKIMISAYSTKLGISQWYPLMIGKPYNLDTTQRHDWEYDYTNTLDLVSSYTLKGGPEEPFEKITLKMSKRAFARTYPDIDISVTDEITENEAGARFMISQENSRIKVLAVGRGEYVIKTIKSNDNVVTLTGYCPAELLAAKNIPGDMPTWNSPLEAILDIITNTAYWGEEHAKDVFTPDRIFCNAVDITGWDILKDPYPIWILGLAPTEEIQQAMDNSSRSAWTVQPNITGDDINLWRFIQACACLINAKVFFANNRAYIIDYTRLNSIDEFAYRSVAGHPRTPYHSANRLILRAGLDRGIYPITRVGRTDLPWGLTEEGTTHEEYVNQLNELNSVELHSENSLDRVAGRIYGTVSQEEDIESINTVVVKYNTLVKTDDGFETKVKKIMYGSDGKDTNQYSGEFISTSQNEDGADLYVPSAKSIEDSAFNGFMSSKSQDGINLEAHYQEVQARIDNNLRTTKTVRAKVLDLTPYFKYIPDEYARRAVYYMLDYYGEPRLPISFTVNERCSGAISLKTTGYGESYWSPVFPIVSAARQFTDVEQEIHISAMSLYSPGEYLPQKLALTQYSRDYPSGRTKYLFGASQTIDLASEMGLMDVKIDR